MKVNRDEAAFWLSVVSALQTPIALLQPVSFFAKCGALLIGFLGLSSLILLILRRRGIVLFGKRITAIVGLVEKVKQKADAFDPTGQEWNKKLDDLRYILSDTLDCWPNRYLGGDLWVALSARVPWDSAKTNGEGLARIFEKTLILCNTSEFLKDFHSWQMSGMGKCAPGRGIDAEVDVAIKGEIAQRIIDKFTQWFSSCRTPGDMVSVLFVGANDRNLSVAILRGMGNVADCRGLQVFVAGTAGENELYLRLQFGKDDGDGNGDKIILQRERDRQHKYDVAIATHYYQHHELTHYKRMPLSVVDDGLVVWLSALSRSPSEDEFVCEGCMPLRATLSAQKISGPLGRNRIDCGQSTAIEIESMSKAGAREWISYEPIRGFENDVPVLSSGYPKKFVVDQNAFYANPAETIYRYLHWNKQQPISRLLIESEYHEREDNSLFRYEITDVECVASTRISDTDSSPWFGVFELRYKSDRAHSLYLLVNTGLEINEWDPMTRGKGQCMVTITPAILYLSEMRSRNADSPRTLVAESLKYRFEKDDAIRSGKYAAMIDQGRLKSDNDNVSVFELRTKIEDVELNHLVFVVASRAVDGRDAVFCSYLPKRRYLTQRDYDIEYGLMEDFKHAIMKMDESALKDFMPVMTHSVTWLRSIEGLINDFAERGLEIKNEECFFHKALGRLSVSDIDMKKYKDKCLDVEGLTSVEHTLRKDIAFNKLTFKDRIKMLGIANVHDVLLFATPKIRQRRGLAKLFRNLFLGRMRRK